MTLASGTPRRGARPLARFSILCILCLLLAACSGGTEPDPPPPPAAPPAETTPPVVSGLVRGRIGTAAAGVGFGKKVFLPSDTVRFRVVAQDQQALRWIGFRLTVDGATFSDSLFVADSIARVQLELSVEIPPEAGLRGQVALRGFAHDAAGNTAELALQGSPVWLAVTGVAARDEYAVDAEELHDIALDLKRDRVYLTPLQRHHVAVYDLAARSRIADLPMPDQPRGIDLMPGDDSLIVALHAVDGFVVQDLTGATPSSILVPDTTSAPGRVAAFLRISADGRVFAGGRETWSGLMEWVPATGSQRFLRTLGTGAVGRTTDRSHVVWSGDGTQIYSAASQELASRSASIGGMDVSGIDAPGGRLLVWRTLYSFPQMVTLATIETQVDSRASALSPDGGTIYFGTPRGVLRLRTSDGIGYDEIDLGGSPSRLLAHPDGRRLLAIVNRKLVVATLPQLPALARGANPDVAPRLRLGRTPPAR